MSASSVTHLDGSGWAGGIWVGVGSFGARLCSRGCWDPSPTHPDLAALQLLSPSAPLPPRRATDLRDPSPPPQGQAAQHHLHLPCAPSSYSRLRASAGEEAARAPLPEPGARHGGGDFGTGSGSGDQRQCCCSQASFAPCPPATRPCPWGLHPPPPLSSFLPLVAFHLRPTCSHPPALHPCHPCLPSPFPVILHPRPICPPPLPPRLSMPAPSPSSIIPSDLCPRPHLLPSLSHPPVVPVPLTHSPSLTSGATHPPSLSPSPSSPTPVALHPRPLHP